MRRVFIGIRIASDILDCLEALKVDLPGARWTKPSNAHVTITFIGNVEDAVVNDIISAMHSISFPKFSLDLDNLGIFKRNKKASVLWLGVKSKDGALQKLKEEVDTTLQSIGVDFQVRKYVPHVTLARLRSVSSGEFNQFLEKYSFEFSFNDIQVSNFILYQSVGSGNSLEYVELAKYNLQQF